MAVLGINLVHQVARLLNEIEVPGNKTDSANFHITLLYLGDNVDIKAISKAMESTYSISQNTGPFIVKVNKIDYFNVPAGKMFPIIAPVVSQKLHNLRKNLKSSFSKNKVDFVESFKEYKPHVTLAFNDEPIKKTKIQPIEWCVQELVLWTGLNGDEKLFITFPLTLKSNCEKVIVEDL